MLLTYDLHFRNADPCFHLVSCYEKHSYSHDFYSWKPFFVIPNKVLDITNNQADNQM